VFGFMLAALPSALVGVSVLDLLGGARSGSFVLDKVVTSVLSSVLVAGSMVLTYVLLLWLFRVPELREVQRQMKARLSRR